MRAVRGLPNTIEAGLFDLDGVLTDTAAVHRRAWKQTFDAYLAQHEPSSPFTDQDYLRYVDGRPREDGVRTFLESRGIQLPPGEDDDAPGAPTVRGLATAKNELLLSLLDQEGVRVYSTSVAYLREMRAAGLRIGYVTSSANAATVLAAAGLTELGDACVDGGDIARRGLRGKPAPDSFLAAADQLGTPPEHAAVFEDAVAGVAAGRAGGFGFVVGIDRVGGDQAEALREAGAHTVVGDLAELRDSPGLS